MTTATTDNTSLGETELGETGLGEPGIREDGGVIDLRDPSVANGLAAALESIVSLSERAGAAEARAEWNRNERMAAAGQLRKVNSDLEQEAAERHRLEVELATCQRELVLRQEQLAEARREIRQVHDQLKRAVATADREVTNLRAELAETRRGLHLLEAMVSRRKRRVYKALVEDA